MAAARAGFVRQQQFHADAGIDGANDRRAPQQRVARREFIAESRPYSIQPRQDRDHRSRWPDQNHLPMLLGRQGATSAIASTTASALIPHAALYSRPRA